MFKDTCLGGKTSFKQESDYYKIIIMITLRSSEREMGTEMGGIKEIARVLAMFCLFNLMVVTEGFALQ